MIKVELILKSNPKKEFDLHYFHTVPIKGDYISHDNTYYIVLNRIHTFGTDNGNKCKIIGICIEEKEVPK